MPQMPLVAGDENQTDAPAPWLRSGGRQDHRSADARSRQRRRAMLCTYGESAVDIVEAGRCCSSPNAAPLRGQETFVLPAASTLEFEQGDH